MSLQQAILKAKNGDLDYKVLEALIEAAERHNIKNIVETITLKAVNNNVAR